MRKSDYSVRLLTPEEFVHWDNLVVSSEQGTLFHQTPWLRALGEPFRILGCFDGAGEMVGGMPLPYARRLGLALSRPAYFLPYSGPVLRRVAGKSFNRVSAYKKIVEPLARALAEDLHYARIHIQPMTTDIQPFIWQGFVSQVRYTYMVDLEDLEAAFKALDVDRRNDIAKGIRDGLVCEESADVTDFIPLLLSSLRVQGLKWPDTRLDQFRRCFSVSHSMGRGALFYVRDANGELLGGGWLVWDERCSYYLLVGMDRQLAGRTAVPTLIWHMMRFTRESLGLRWFDFDGADVPQIENFVRAFGGFLTPFFVTIWLSPALRPLWLLRQLYLQRRI